MPIYEYQCPVCGHQLEVMQKFSDEPLKKCPKCNKESLQKLISAAGFQLKGTGWYKTDFRDKAKPETKDKPNQTDSSDKSTGTSDKKEG